MTKDLDFADDPRRGCAPDKVTAEAFFADRSNPEIELARDACRGCPVRDECLDRALDQDEQFGIWAGVLMSSKPERRKAIEARENRHVTRLWLLGIDDTAISLRLPFEIHPSTVAKIRKRCGLPANAGRGGKRVAGALTRQAAA